MALKQLAPRLLKRNTASSSSVADTAPSGACSLTPGEMTDRNPYGWEQEKLRMQLENDAHMQTERLRLAKVWAWTGAFVACYALSKAESTHKHKMDAEISIRRSSGGN